MKEKTLLKQDFSEEFRLGRVLQKINNCFRRMGDENLSNHGISLSQLRILAYLAKNEGRGDVYQKDLEEAFGIRRSSVSGILQNMEKAGYLSREGSLHDARVKRVVLTEKGKKLDQSLLDYIRSLEEEMLCGFLPEEREQLKGMLLRVLENLETAERNKV